ncbi:MAG TPA: pantoate--beta-alanine ligase [candidate division WOR-3 bacterium]|uniref:Pantothenate synthetase n=1 Tax=candidate division WOR-3 bacterium TaxID=2052148 RepID=A0A7C0VE07_UNCW3|nr:pantoate--beta-alanine ligase [candidate division WOR-3 bacterium]
MRIATRVDEMKSIAEEYRKNGKRISFVPTMGYLHEGHLSLVDIARKDGDICVVSIFVNPIQFGPGEDYERYPRDVERDERLLEQRGCDVLFYPSASEMYPEDFLTRVRVEKLSSILCGKSRPGHFEGVTTVVLKLFNIVKPHVAVFGEKDYQQLVIIKRMVRDLNLDVEIVAGEIIREKDGLAMSSRNVYLDPVERKQATCLFRSMLLAQDMVKAGIRDTKTIVEAVGGFIKKFDRARIDYVKIVHPDTLEELEEIHDRARILLAVYFGKARLIDNMEIDVP